MRPSLIFFFLVLFSFRTFSATNIVLTAQKPITIKENTWFTFITNFIPSESNSKCFLEHERVNYPRTIQSGFRFVVESLNVEYSTLDDVSYRNFLKYQLESLGGIYEGQNIIGEPILSPRSLVELENRILEVGAKPLHRNNSSITLLIGEADRKINLICNSDRQVSLDQIFEELYYSENLVPSEIF